MVVSLSVHKNNVLQKNRKAIRRSFVRDVKQISQLRNIAGYAVIAWDESAGHSMCWNNSDRSGVPTALIPTFFNDAMSRELAEIDRKK